MQTYLHVLTVPKVDIRGYHLRYCIGQVVYCTAPKVDTCNREKKNEKE